MSKIGDVSDEITIALRDFTNEVTDEMEEIKIDVAKETVKQLRNKSPKNSGEYAKGWTRKKQGNAQIIHNKNKPQLTHLLEKGHAKRGGGRVPGKVHIAPIEEWAIDEYTKRVEKVIKG